MTLVQYRLLFSALAFFPSLALLILPEAARIDLAYMLGIGGTLGALSLLTITAVHLAGAVAPRRPEPRTVDEGDAQAPHTPERLEDVDDTALEADDVKASETHEPAPPPVASLLVSGALRDLPTDLPPPEARRLRIAQALDMAAQPPEGVSGSPDHARACVIAQVADLWGASEADALDAAQITELALLDRLMHLPRDEAEPLIDLFIAPRLLRDAHAKIAALGERHAARLDGQALCAATERLRKTQVPARTPGGLLLALQALEEPDPDLWHRVVTEHDPEDATQAEAALWCVRQLGCHRATIALYLSERVAEDAFDAAAERGDRAWLAGIGAVLVNWGQGRYRASGIGLFPADRLIGQAPALSDALDRLSERLDEPRWPTPSGMMTVHTGRPPRPRPAWDLASGRLTEAPDPDDYAPQP
ncbi:hypothetical protein [Litorisediminicola beolgyonensis]|uniref:DUF1266 domain-containing protein n=1 Tax=Litorisediminicola beolgyonensis TaxID=1173614 RepID=A0ABW3ZNI4_9RHOB